MKRVIASRRAALSLVEDVPATGVQGWQVARTGIGYLVCTHYYAQVLKRRERRNTKNNLLIKSVTNTISWPR